MNQTNQTFRNTGRPNPGALRIIRDRQIEQMLDLEEEFAEYGLSYRRFQKLCRFRRLYAPK